MLNDLLSRYFNFAESANNKWLPPMSLHVLLLVGNLVEMKPAALHEAGEGLLASVDAQMIEEVAPLPEKLSTVSVIAREHGRCPVGPRVLVFNEAESLSAWQNGLVLIVRQILSFTWQAM